MQFTEEHINTIFESYDKAVQVFCDSYKLDDDILQILNTNLKKHVEEHGKESELPVVLAIVLAARKEFASSVKDVVQTHAAFHKTLTTLTQKITEAKGD